jgi:DNA-binding NtrC family response regulator
MPDEELSKLYGLLSLILEEIRSTRKAASPSSPDETSPDEAPKENWPDLANIERVYVEHVLRHTAGNKQAAARILNVDRKTLDRMIKRHKLDLSELQTRH